MKECKIQQWSLDRVERVPQVNRYVRTFWIDVCVLFVQVIRYRYGTMVAKLIYTNLRKTHDKKPDIEIGMCKKILFVPYSLVLVPVKID